MSKKKDVQIWWILGAVLFVILIYGGSQGWFQFIINVSAPNQTLSLVPNSQEPIYNSCNDVCSSNGFSKFYSFFDTCKAGESKVTYGYPGQSPLLTCCCYNEAVTPTHTCTDTDNGENKDVPGTVTYDSVDRYMDRCEDATTVYEYKCLSDGTWGGSRISCDAGETCLSSRSGGYCKASTPTWSPGDTVFEGSGSGVISSEFMQLSELDLSDYGLTAGGTCRLGAIIQTDWNYASPTCQGIQGTEGVVWKLFDSVGLEYQRLDAVPVGLSVDLSPANGHILEWDGTTKWVGIVSKTLNIPNCLISYNYNIKIYIYDC